MDKWCNNRLTVIGPKASLQRFLKSNWDQRLPARYTELMENSPQRFACHFETEELPLEALRRLSGHWVKLLLLLDYEVEAERTKGLAKASTGRLEHWETRY